MRSVVLLMWASACATDSPLVGACGRLPGEPLYIQSTDYRLWGAASALRDDVIELTPAGPARQGAAFDLNHLLSAHDIDIQFEFEIASGTGADGFALTLVDPVRAETEGVLDGVYIGGAGACLGITTTPDFEAPDCGCGSTTRWLPGWSVEFDTWWNSCSDPVDLQGEPILPHGAFELDGQIMTPRATWSLAGLERGRWHTARVALEKGVLTVEVDGQRRFEGTALDSGVQPAFKGLIGFTASTGEEVDRHRIRDVSVRSASCDAVPTED